MVTLYNTINLISNNKTDKDDYCNNKIKNRTEKNDCMQINISFISTCSKNTNESKN